MSNNRIEKTIYYIGVIIIVVGIIGSIICGSVFKSVSFNTSYLSSSQKATYNWAIAIIGSIISFISGMFLIGFSEIIYLLKLSINKQEDIIRYLKTNSTTNTEPSKSAKTVLQDIESNLPKM